MTKFYFTYGSEGHPFIGGWTEVEAPDEDTACAAFQAFHADGSNDLLNCCGVYDEANFKRTKMYGPKGNFGYRCHEKITLRRYLIGEGGASLIAEATSM